MKFTLKFKFLQVCSLTKMNSLYQIHSKMLHSTKVIILVRKKGSSDREKLLKFEAEGQEFSKILRSLKWIHYTRFAQKCCIARK